jgi:serine/threonine protein kinase
LSKTFSSEESTFFTSCGTIQYMAPEVIQGKSYDTKCDVWSAGIILYEILFGKNSFSIIKSVKDCSKYSQRRTKIWRNFKWTKKFTCKYLKKNLMIEYFSKIFDFIILSKKIIITNS